MVVLPRLHVEKHRIPSPGPPLAQLPAVLHFLAHQEPACDRVCDAWDPEADEVSPGWTGKSEKGPSREGSTKSAPCLTGFTRRPLVARGPSLNGRPKGTAADVSRLNCEEIRSAKAGSILIRPGDHVPRQRECFP